jgi:hypothetical protein
MKSMKLHLRSRPSARDLANLHQLLGRAHGEAIQAVTLRSAQGAQVLTAASADAVNGLAQRLSAALFSMESDFMRVTGDRNAPFACASEPDRWLEYLDRRDGVENMT